MKRYSLLDIRNAFLSFSVVSRVKELVKNSSQERKSKFLLGGVIGLPILFIFLTLTFYFLSTIQSFTRERKNIQISYENFVNYEKAVSKIGNHLKEENETGGLDSETFTREAKKGSQLLEAHTKEIEGIANFMHLSSSNNLKEYKKQVNTYIELSKKVVDIEREAVKMYESYITPFEDNEEVSIALAGDRFYMYSEPFKYEKSLDDNVKVKNRVISEIEKIELKSYMKDVNTLVIRKFKSEIDYLLEVKVAVQANSDTKATEAEQKYRKSQQQIAKEFDQLSLQIKDTINNKIEEMDAVKKQIEKEYERIGK